MRPCEQRLQAFGFELVAHRRRAPVLPDDRVAHGLAGVAIPDDRGLALIGDADRRDVASAAHPRRPAPRCAQSSCVRQISQRVLLDPARLREDLRRFALRQRAHLASMIEHDRARAGGALIQSEQKSHASDDDTRLTDMLEFQRLLAPVHASYAQRASAAYTRRRTAHANRRSRLRQHAGVRRGAHAAWVCCHPSASPAARAAHRRRVLGHRARRSAGRADLPQARVAQAQSAGRLAGAGRAQSLGSRMDAKSRRRSSPTRCRACWAKTRSPACSPWSTSTRRTIRCGRRSCAKAMRTPRSRHRSERRIASHPCAHRAARRSRARSSPPTTSSFRSGLSPISPPRRVRIPISRRSSQRLIEVTGSTKLALVHGDVSPKNILCGPHGPVFLDAECAWYGDPAFDLAFCLNHMLLKCVWRPQSTIGLSRVLRRAGPRLSREA